MSSADRATYRSPGCPSQGTGLLSFLSSHYRKQNYEKDVSATIAVPTDQRPESAAGGRQSHAGCGHSELRPQEVDLAEQPRCFVRIETSPIGTSSHLRSTASAAHLAQLIDDPKNGDSLHRRQPVGHDDIGAD